MLLLASRTKINRLHLIGTPHSLKFIGWWHYQLTWLASFARITYFARITSTRNWNYVLTVWASTNRWVSYGTQQAAQKCRYDSIINIIVIIILNCHSLFYNSIFFLFVVYYCILTQHTFKLQNIFFWKVYTVSTMTIFDTFYYFSSIFRANLQ